MKKLLPSALALILATLAHADLTVTQKIVQAQPSKEMTMIMKVKGDKMRMDVDAKMSTILNLKSGDMQTLIHDQKVVMTIPGAVLKSMQQSKSPGSGGGGLEATGHKETISGFACEEYVMTGDGVTVHLWLTKDLPAAEKLMKEMSSLAPDSNPFNEAMKNQNVSGFPMRTIVEMPGGGKTTMSVVAVKENPLADADFSVPSGYKAMQVPAIPGR
jgi:hypothetical protein